MKKVITLLASALLVVTYAKAADTKNNKVSEKHQLSNEKKWAPIVEEPILIPQLEVKDVRTEYLRDIINENNKIIDSAPVDFGWFVESEKPVEQTISENQQIIEEQPDSKVYPLFLDRTIEDQIAEDNAIIEANIQ